MQMQKMANGQELSEVSTLLARADYAGALGVLLPLVQSHRICPISLEATIICYSGLRDDATAWALSDMAIAQFPDASGLWSARARLASEAGKLDLAREASERALELDPNNLGALVQLNTLKTFDKGSKRDKQLRRVLKKSSNSAMARAEGHRAVALIEQKAGYYTRAFFQFTQSNQHQDRTYDPAEDTAFVAAQRSLFEARGTAEAARYLFIGGMPRSGTTLIETALMRHPSVASAGETTCLTYLQKRLGQGASAFDWCKTRDEGVRSALRAQLIDALEPSRGGAQLLLEKLPLGVFHYGLVQWLLPEARFVVMQRHPLACGLSNYQANFYRGYGYSTRLETIAQKYLAVEASAEDYARKMPSLLRIQSYRALVDAPEQELRAICSLAELPWDPAVLTPEAASHVQRTHSMMQVREGINRKGLDRWKHYEAQLDPLRSALGGAGYLAIWEARDAAMI